MTNRYAVIEIGTRGLRLLIADANERGITRVVRSTGDLSYLGENRLKNGAISKKGMKIVQEVVEQYIAETKKFEVQNTVAIATEVIRAAPNQDEFIDFFAPILAVKVLSPEDEATSSFLASTSAFRHTLSPRDKIIVIDQGGGSTELSYGTIEADGTIILKGLDSVMPGSVELVNAFVGATTLIRGFNEVRSRVNEALAKHSPFPDLDGKKVDAAFGMGSSLTSLMTANYSDEHGQRPKLWELHGYVATQDNIKRQIDFLDGWLATIKKNDRNFDFSPEAEISTIISGISTYYEIMNRYGAASISLSRHGLRYGVLLREAGLKFRTELPTIVSNS